MSTAEEAGACLKDGGESEDTTLGELERNSAAATASLAAMQAFRAANAASAAAHAAHISWARRCRRRRAYRRWLHLQAQPGQAAEPLSMPSPCATGTSVKQLYTAHRQNLAAETPAPAGGDTDRPHRLPVLGTPARGRHSRRRHQRRQPGRSRAAPRGTCNLSELADTSTSVATGPSSSPFAFGGRPVTFVNNTQMRHIGYSPARPCPPRAFPAGGGVRGATMPTMVFTSRDAHCWQCGFNIVPGAGFCEVCGARKPGLRALNAGASGRPCLDATDDATDWNLARTVTFAHQGDTS